jgi:hypothetical protein
MQTKTLLLLCLLVTLSASNNSSPEKEYYASLGKLTSEERMNGCKTRLLYGNVSKVTYSNGCFVEFNGNGNIVRAKNTPDGEVNEYKYVNPKRYTLYGQPYNILFNDTMRTEEEDSSEKLNTHYVFDEKGRLKKQGNYAYYSESEEYHYKGDELHPFKSVITISDSGWEAEIANLYTYTKTDDHGNWLECKVVSTKVESEMGDDPVKTTERTVRSRTIEYFTEGSNTAGKSEDTGELTKSTGKQAASKTSTNDTLILVLICVLLLAIIAHTVYINYFHRRYRSLFTTGDFRALRRGRGIREAAFEEENRQAGHLLEQAFQSFPVIGQRNGEEYRKPQSRKQIKKAVAYINQAIALEPTDEKTVERLNGLIEVVHMNEMRLFDGSFITVIATVLLSIIFFIAVGFPAFLAYFGCAAIYYLVSHRPVYLIDKRHAQKSGKTWEGYSYMISQAGTAEKMKSMSVNTSPSGNIFIAIINGIYIFYWVVWKYIRNYLL